MRLHEGGDAVATIRLQRDEVADQRDHEPVVVDTARRDSLDGRKLSSFHVHHHGNGRPFRVRPDNPPDARRPDCIYGLVDIQAECIYSLLVITWDEPKRLRSGPTFSDSLAGFLEWEPCGLGRLS